MLFVFGFGGLANTGKVPEFHPNLPREISRLEFAVTIRGNSIRVDMDREESRYTLAEGEGVELSHDGRGFRLSPEEPTFSTRTRGAD